MPDVILASFELGGFWPTVDPFLFCVHHDDHYPAGNAEMGPDASLEGRRMGMDFEGRDGWRMYHGRVVPGFPQHPHRGFETVTIARRGFIDHSDSLGATARFGAGDVQWMTAGRGIVHSEMFPLRRREADNPTELFQLWLNLPAAKKMVDPHFSMLWAPTIPEVQIGEEGRAGVSVRVIAGVFAGQQAAKPPPHSWASAADSEVAIWTIRIAAGARLTLPPAKAGLSRTLYVFRGEGLRLDGHRLPARCGLRLDPEAAISLVSGDVEVEVLLLQGRPIGESVVQHGPFVMNTAAEIQQAIRDYQRTGFGAWPWASPGPVHPRQAGRFAVHADGRRESPAQAETIEPTE
ncbi:MAG TPA: pirin family protein [Nannocystis exedens]|nr:pirin family protein [Nannocystis exedens]